jgi:conjugal transfer mating pair stabilization protein TraN
LFKIKTLLFIPIISFALNCSLVREVKEYGGHYYAVTTGATTFLEAKKFAEDNGGYLAIPNSNGENSFIQSLIPKPNYAWIGVYDPDYTTNYCYEGDTCAYDNDRFIDIKGNGLSYTNWADKQPDNLVKHYDIFKGKQMVSPLGEHWVAMSSVTGEWGDFGNHKDEYTNPIKFLAIIEFEEMPECYTPPSDVKETDYTKPKCNTQIYDDSTSTTYTGETIDCLQDRNNDWYCPSALAQCREEWSYRDGYSKLVITHKETEPKCLEGYSYNQTTNKCERIEQCY